MSRPRTSRTRKTTDEDPKPGVAGGAVSAPDRLSPTTMRFRPAVRRLSAWTMIGLGSLIALANWVAELGVDIMPGGHNELYFLGGLTAVGTGAWMLGAFSQPDGRRRK